MYDYNTGKLISLKDENSAVTTYSYSDPLNRITQIVHSDGGQTNVTYPSPTHIIVYRDQNAFADQAIHSESYYDGLGRLTESDQYESSSTYISTSQNYDALGRVYQTSNPLRPGDANWSTKYATDHFYDALDRPTQVTTEVDNASVFTSYAGNSTTATDQTGRKRTTTTDGLGRLKSVIEDPTINGHTGLNYTTVYSYDPLDDLICVNQAAASTTAPCSTTASGARLFTYDSFKRLTAATNPESGTINYSYDLAGNLLTKQDARTVITCFGVWSAPANCDSSANKGYDKLNRPVLKTYSDGTPQVNYYYDTATNGKGRLAQIANSVSSTIISAYDSVGHIKASSQVTSVSAGGQTSLFTYNFPSYKYNLAGDLLSETYPSGRTVTTSYDAANRPVTLSGTLGSAATSYIGDPTVTSYTTDFTKWIFYSPHGAPWAFVRGNGLTHAESYNGRLQLTESYESIDNVNTAARMLFVSCPHWGTAGYVGLYSICQPGVTGTTNNGNLIGYDEYIGGPGNGNAAFTTPTFSQTGIGQAQIAYDGVNRLQSISDSGDWSRSFLYDANGNMTESGSGVSLNVNAPQGQPASTYDANNRRQDPGFQYDASGNMKAMPSGSLTYDAENRVLTTSMPMPNTYFYDGEGRRVLKIGPTDTTVYVYDAAGQLTAEYDTAAQSAPCTTCYLSYDHLGSVRLITDGANPTHVVSRHDYLPFGEEITQSQGGRVSSTFLFGSLDNVTQRFTGKERDQESGLDYFGARYYGSAMGRFASVDPEGASASLFDPQRWNGYSYAVNNPYKFVDRDGEVPVLLVSAGVGLAVGAGGGALFDVGNQLIQNGGHFDQINGREVWGATVGGAVSGGIAGLTLGLIPAPAALTAGYLTTSAIVNGGANVVGGAVQREIDPDATGSATTDFAAGAVGGAVGTKLAYVRYPLPNVKKELEAIAFSNRRSLRPARVANLNANAARQSRNNVVFSSVVGTAVANFFTTLWSDFTHTNSEPKACVEAHDSQGNGTGKTCSN